MTSPGTAPPTIEHFEGLAPKVWPPASSQQLDGWLLCFADGCTKRANSVHCQNGMPGDFVARVKRCESVYRELGQKVVFKLTEASRPVGLDDFLESRGYEVVEPTSVQLRSQLAARSVPGDLLARVEIAAELTDPWSEACMRISHVAPASQPPLHDIFQRIQRNSSDSAFAELSADGEIVAHGVGVLRDGNACLCEIATDESHRRRGFGVAIVAALCDWAAARNSQAWLQVVAANERAVALYHGLGFREMYRHWYRVSA